MVQNSVLLACNVTFAAVLVRPAAQTITFFKLFNRSQKAE